MKPTIISSFATDTLIREESLETKVGGPAYFITSYLDRAKVNYNLITGARGQVEVDLRNGREAGRIKSVGEIVLPFQKITGLVLVSTLLDEFPLQAVGDFCCVDVQGYVRDGTDFGLKKYFDSPELAKCPVVKSTREEVKWLSPERVKNLPLLLVTSGSEGFQIATAGRLYQFEVEKVAASDTIGAGDTFFTAFCLCYYQAKNVSVSARFAAKAATEFLKMKGRERP